MEEQVIPIDELVPDIKPGHKTTEFWLTLVSYVLAGLVMYGVVNIDEAQRLVDSLGIFIAAAGGLIVALGPIVSTVMYVYSRTKVKNNQQVLQIALLQSDTVE